MSGGSYTFGDSTLAADRLALVAQLFRPVTARLLTGLLVGPLQLTVDLGCGPGYTTALVKELLAPERLIGVESSPAFVEEARRRVGTGGEVLCADVRDLPDEVQAADLIFTRFLLTHLTDPLQAIEHWLGRLSPQGVVAVQEVESIATDESTLKTYLALQRRMLEANGHALDIGPVLAEAVWASGTIRQNRVVRIEPPVTAAAQMFAMNFTSWRTQPAVQQLASGQELDQIEEGLARLLTHPAADASIAWELREVVISGRSPDEDASSGRPPQ